MQSQISNGNVIPVSPRNGQEVVYRYNRTKEDHFPTKLYRMLEDVEKVGNKSIISWSNDGLFFVVHQPKVFAEGYMKKYFNQSKYKSFQRQLNFYKFQRVAHGKVLGVYSHLLFRRGHMETLNEIRRMRQQPSVASLALKARKGARKTDDRKALFNPPAITTIMNGSSMIVSPVTTKPAPTFMKNQRTVPCDYFNNLKAPPRLFMLDPSLFVNDSMNHEISLNMKPYNNSNMNMNALESRPSTDSFLLYEDDDDATSIGTIENVSVEICRSTFEHTPLSPPLSSMAVAQCNTVFYNSISLE